MTIKSKFKILVGRFEDYYGKVSEEYKDVSFEELCEIKGIKSLRKQTDTFSYRSRTDRPKVFGGTYANKCIKINPKIKPNTKTLEEYVADNNIVAYVSTWLTINHLVQ